MRVFNQGAYVRVTVSADDVRRFNQTWPGSDIPNRPCSFEFDARNGDLVDVAPRRVSDIDGPEVSALSHDAQNYAVSRGLLPDFCRRD